jgi:ADP-ribose pyrophosphatase YjhB (NUDIX family)
MFDPKTPIETWYFALAVVRLGHRFLLVRERKHEQRWYWPAGRMHHGEQWQACARRETFEESGVSVNLEGILRIEHSPQPSISRMRVVFIGSPADDTPPRHLPNEHTLEAGWFSAQEMGSLPMRSQEVLEIAAYVLGGGTIYPLNLLRAEGTSWTL